MFKYGFILNTSGIQSSTTLKFQRVLELYQSSIHEEVGISRPGWVCPETDTELLDSDLSNERFVPVLFDTPEEAQRYRAGVNAFQNRITSFAATVPGDSDDPIFNQAVEDAKRMLLNGFLKHK